MSRAVRVAVVLTAICGSALPARAAEVATVDEVLAAVADVIQDRAERVASATIQRKLQGRLCDGNLVLFEPAVEQKQPYLELRLGGARCPAGLGVCAGPEAERGCRRWDKACTADDVFVRSCRLLQQEGVPLSDPHFLKSLSEDTVSLLLRLSGARLPAERYAELGLARFAGYVHRAMEVLGTPGSDLADLARPTAQLADELSTGMPATLVAELGKNERTVRLLSQVRAATDEWIAAGCPFTRADGTKQESCAKNRPAVWTPELLAEGKPVAEACRVWLSPSAREERTRTFRTLFKEPGAPFAAAEERRCSAMNLVDPGLRECQLARVTFNLRDLLSRLTCHELNPDPRGTVRQLGYAMGQRAAFQEAVGGLAMDEFVTATSELKLDDLPREELAYGVRVVARLLQAQHEDRRATQEWAAVLLGELRKVDPRAPASFDALLDGAALDTTQLPANARVRELRDATKDFLTLPSLHLRQSEGVIDSAVEARSRLLGAMTQILELDPSADDLPRAVGEVADYLLVVADVAEQTRTTFERELTAHATPELEQEVQTRVREGGAALTHAAAALRTTSGIVQRASEGDWVGLGLRVSDALMTARADEGVRRQLRFVRVLMSMYQARTVEEAKGIFHATLEDEASRERRYDAMTFDLGVLIAPRVGWQWNQRFEPGAPSSSSDGLIVGLYAPVGVQWAHGSWGVLVYPVDVGAYLVVGPGEAGPQWPDALRAGVAGYARPWRDLPIVFGAGTDYRPLIDHTQEWRLFGFAALELPLYLLH